MINRFFKKIKNLFFPDNPMLNAVNEYLERSRKEIAEIISKLP